MGDLLSCSSTRSLQTHDVDPSPVICQCTPPRKLHDSRIFRWLLAGVACCLVLGANLFIGGGVSFAAGPVLTVSPLSLTAGQNCPASQGGWTCTATVGATGRFLGLLSWSASTTLAGVTFTPASGALSAGKTTSVTIFVPSSACSQGAFLFNGTRSNSVRVQWICTPQPAMLAVTPASFAAGVNCPVNNASGWTCTATVGEAAGTSGVLTWSVSSALPGVSFAPASGTLRSGGQTTRVTISIPSGACTTGTFTFVGHSGGSSNTVTPAWSCSPTLAVSPTAFSPGHNCVGASGSWTCKITVSLAPHSAPGTLNWTASSNLGGVTFTPASGTISQGNPQQITISIPNYDCSPGTFNFAGQGSNTVNASWSCTPLGTLTVSPQQLQPGASTCSTTGNTYQCVVTLTTSSPGAVTWTASSSLGGVTFIPPSGTVSHSQAASVTITSIPCQSGTFAFSGSLVSSAVASWSCTPPPTLTATPASLDQNSTNCTADGPPAFTYHCNVALAESASSVGIAKWTTGSSLSGVTFTPASGTLSPGNTQVVTISAIPCQNGSFTFRGQEGEAPVSVSWSCTPPPPPPTLTASPTSLDQNNANCSPVGNAYQCSITLGETAGSQGNANWTVTSTLGAVVFNPTSGTLSPGNTQVVMISAIPCQNGSFTFTGAEGEAPVSVSWTCTPPPPPPTLTATPTSLDQNNANCSLVGSAYQCSITLGETAGSQGNANWSVASDLAGASFSPTSGTLTPGTTQAVTISTVPCQNGSFTFTGAEGEAPVSVSWSCTTSQPPTLTVTPSILFQSSPECQGATHNYSCTVILGETAVSQGNVNWSASGGNSGSIFTPSSGTLSPGQTVSVSFGSESCDTANQITFSSSDNAAVNPVSVNWNGGNCAPELVATPANLDPTNPNCSATSTGGPYQCTVTLSDTLNSPPGNVNWSSHDDLGVATFNPPSGTLSPGQSVTVAIGSLPCQTEGLAFLAPGATNALLTWTCSSASSTATLTQSKSGNWVWLLAIDVSGFWRKSL